MESHLTNQGEHAMAIIQLTNGDDLQTCGDPKNVSVV